MPREIQNPSRELNIQTTKDLLNFFYHHSRLTLENIQTSNGLVAHLENEAQSAVSTGSTEQNNADEDGIDLGEETEEGDADEDDVSFITKALTPMFSNYVALQ